MTGTKTVDPAFVASYSRLNGGKPYSPENLRKASERLRQLGVFSSITIKEANELAPDGTIPMTIEVSEGKHRYFGAGAQYSTTDGFGIQGYWGHRNLFGRAESLRVEGSVNRIGETADVGNLDYSAGLLFAKPGAFGPASIFNASLKAQLLDPDAYSATIFTGAAGATFELSDTDTISGGGELSWADVDDAFGSNEYLTAAIPIEYVRDTRDDKLNPTAGYRASINAKPSYEINGQTFFSSFEGSASAYLGLGEENRFVLAGKLGAGVLAGGDGLASIPANRRFYLGGGGTVRGYSYQEISPRNARRRNSRRTLLCQRLGGGTHRHHRKDRHRPLHRRRNRIGQNRAGFFRYSRRRRYRPALCNAVRADPARCRRAAECLSGRHQIRDLCRHRAILLICFSRPAAVRSNFTATQLGLWINHESFPPFPESRVALAPLLPRLCPCRRRAVSRALPALRRPARGLSPR